MTSAHPNQPVARSRRLRRWTLRFVLLILIALVGVELFARFGLGLGDPILYDADPKIEYLVRPGTYHRAGNTVFINRWHMRCGQVDTSKPDNEHRVFVIGDSVVFAGARIPDDETATALLEQSLRTRDQKPVRVLNASAASWGPMNEAAFIDRFGLFSADVLIIVLNSCDLGDNPTFDMVGTADYPTHTPLLALQEVIGTYIPRLLARTPRSAAGSPAQAPWQRTPPEADSIKSLDALRHLITTARAAGVRVAVVHHFYRTEHMANRGPAHDRFKAVCDELNVPFLLTEPDFTASGGDALYRDDVHPTSAGQAALASTLNRAYDAATARETPASPATSAQPTPAPTPAPVH